MSNDAAVGCKCSRRARCDGEEVSEEVFSARLLKCISENLLRLPWPPSNLIATRINYIFALLEELVSIPQMSFLAKVVRLIVCIITRPS